jgi:parvulin-like peptidyl-prolyl isomerase
MSQADAPGDAPRGGEAETPPTPAQNRRAQWVLALGATLGLAAATFGLMTPGRRSDVALPEGAVASVNGSLIQRADYERLLAGLAADARNPIDDEARRHVLDRMIDEELLVQRAVELGLVEVDRRVRADLTSNLIESVVSSAEEQEPTRSDLETFYAEEAGFFTRPGRLRVRQVYFSLGPDGDESEVAERAVAAMTALRANRDFNEVRERFGDREVSPIPDALLPALKLREYVGPTVAEAALELEVGEVSDPIRSGTGVHILQLVDLEPTRTPPFDEVEPQVRSEWLRRRGDRALRAYLDGLRADSSVVVVEEP